MNTDTQSGGKVLPDWQPHSKAPQDRGVMVVPITTGEQLEQVKIAAAFDGHANMLLPSHALLKDGKIVGCTSLGNVVLSNSWLCQDSQKLRPRDTVECFRQVEQVARAIGYRAIAVPVPKSSPMHGLMVSRFHYQDAGEMTLFVKMLLSHRLNTEETRTNQNTKG